MRLMLFDRDVPKKMANLHSNILRAFWRGSIIYQGIAWRFGIWLGYDIRFDVMKWFGIMLSEFQ